MFYTFKVNITTAVIAGSESKTTLDLIAGIIHQVDVLFEEDCDNEAKVQIYHGSTLLWPSNQFNADGTPAAITGNATIVSFREFYELKPGATDLTLWVWGDATIDDVDIIVSIGLLPKRVLQPLSFEELLAAATGVK